MNKKTQRKGYTVEEMDKRVAKYIQDGAKRLAAETAHFLEGTGSLLLGAVGERNCTDAGRLAC